MVDILHRVGTLTPTPEKVYHALTTSEGLAGWWTEDTKGSGDVVGGVVAFRFPVGRLRHGGRRAATGRTGAVASARRCAGTTGRADQRLALRTT
jgi:uncharacterized protein YndB with AHSA1/START domain